MKQSYILLPLFLILQHSITYTSDIFHAIAHDKKSMVTQWLKQNSKSTITNDQSQTILHHAVMHNKKSIINKILNTTNVDVNALDQHGSTALDYAVERGHKTIMKNLLKKGARVTTEENARFGKKLLTRTSKIGFFLGAIVLFAGLIICAISSPFEGYAGLGMLLIAGCVGIPGLSTMLICTVPWTVHAAQKFEILEKAPTITSVK